MVDLPSLFAIQSKSYCHRTSWIFICDLLTKNQCKIFKLLFIHTRQIFRHFVDEKSNKNQN